MNSTIRNIFVFATGAAIGSVVTWKVLKTKYEQRVQEEIDSVKEVYSKRYNGRQQSDVIDDDTESTEMTDEEYESVVEEYEAQTSKYRSNANDPVFKTKPCVISPDEFDDLEDYKCIYLTYYADKILTDDDERVIPNVDEVVGLESLNHFGEYEPDTVYVRNDVLKCRYEICADRGNYSDLLNEKPYLAED